MTVRAANLKTAFTARTRIANVMSAFSRARFTNIEGLVKEGLVKHDPRFPALCEVADTTPGFML